MGLSNKKSFHKRQLNSHILEKFFSTGSNVFSLISDKHVREPSDVMMNEKYFHVVTKVFFALY